MITDFYRSIPVMQDGKITGAAEHREFVCDEADVSSLPGADICLPGSIAWDVTTGAYYGFNGTAWVAIQGGGGGSATKLTVTPEMFGAKGDGVTDDTDAVQAAIDSTLPVMFLHDYAISSLTVGSNKVVYGNGHTVKRIATETVDAVLIISDAHDVIVRDLNIDGSYEFYNRITEAEEYTAARAAAKDCVLIGDGSHDIYIDNVHASYGLTGFDISGGSYNVQIAHSSSVKTLADGVHMGQCHDCTVEEHFCYMCQDDAYSANTYTDSTKQPHDCAYINCKAEDHFGRGFNTSGKRIRFIGGQCLNGRSVPINFETRVETNAEDCLVADSFFSTIDEVSAATLNNKKKLMMTATTSSVLKATNCRVSNTVLRSENNADAPNILYMEAGSLYLDGVTIEGYVLHVTGGTHRFEGCKLKLAGGIIVTNSKTDLEIGDSIIETYESAKADMERVIKISNATAKLHGNKYVNAYPQAAIYFGGSQTYPCHVEVDTDDVELNSGGANSAEIASSTWLPYSIANSSNTMLSNGQLVIDAANSAAYINVGTLQKITP